MQNEQLAGAMQSVPPVTPQTYRTFVIQEVKNGWTVQMSNTYMLPSETYIADTIEDAMNLVEEKVNKE